MEANPRVLVVDDCPDTRALYRLYFKKLGADVTTAEDGGIAADAVSDAAQRNEPFVLIILDIAMPNVGGISAARLMREAGYSGLIAACTANYSAENRRESQFAGIDMCFGKESVNEKMLSALLDQAMQLDS